MTNRRRLLATVGIAICIFVIMWADDVKAEEDYGYIEFGAGVRLDGPWEGDYPSYLETGYVWTNVWKKSYVRVYATHMSNIERGAPRNDQSESYIDHVGTAIGWRF